MNKVKNRVKRGVSFALIVAFALLIGVGLLVNIFPREKCNELTVSAEQDSVVPLSSFNLLRFFSGVGDFSFNGFSSEFTPYVLEHYTSGLGTFKYLSDYATYVYNSNSKFAGYFCVDGSSSRSAVSILQNSWSNLLPLDDVENLYYLIVTAIDSKTPLAIEQYPVGDLLPNDIPTSPHSSDTSIYLYYKIPVSDNYQEGYDKGYSEGYSDGIGDDYDKGYSEGYSDGLGDGYDKGHSEGYFEGVDKAQYSIFADATISGTLFFDDNFTLSIDIPAPLTYSGVDFSSISRLYEDYQGYFLDYADLTINLSIPFVYSSSLPFQWLGDSDVMGIVLHAVTGEIYYGAFDYSNDMIASFSDDAVGKSFDKISIHFGRAVDTLYSSLIYMNGVYLGAYEGGYNSGYDNGYHDGFVFGSEQSYESGYQRGFDHGYSSGLEIAEKGDFYHLFMAVIDAPVSVFSSLLDFDILGYNMKSLVLSLLSIALVISAIRLFAGFA